MIGLLDSSNFYVSCERTFDPKLERQPVVVLSNGDDCVVARSDEARAVGHPDGTPYGPGFVRLQGVVCEEAHERGGLRLVARVARGAVPAAGDGESIQEEHLHEPYVRQSADRAISHPGGGGYARGGLRREAAPGGQRSQRRTGDCLADVGFSGGEGGADANHRCAQ